MERGVLLERLARATLTVVMVGGLAGGAGAAGAPGGTSPAATPEAGRGLPAPARGAGAPRAGSEPLLQRLLNSPEGRRLLRGGMDAASLARLEHGYKGAGSPLPLVDDTTLAALRARAARRAPASAHPSAADATNPVQPIQPTLSLAPGAPLPALAGLHPRLAVAPGPIVAGARIPVTLSGFAPRETVVLRLDGHALTHVVANGTGALGVALAIPGATAGGAHTLGAEGQLVRVPARTVLRVLGVRATPGRLAAGTRTGVSGGGFRPGALVTLTLRPVNGQTVTLGLDGADGGGRLRPMRVAIPDDVAAGAATIVARAGDGEEVTTGLYVDAGRPASLAAIPLPSRPAPARTRGLAHHPLPLKGRGAAGARGQGHAFRVSRPHAGRLPTLPAGRPLAGRLPAHAPGRAVGGEGGRAVTSQARARAAYLGLPISFEVNRGQAGRDVRFLAHGADGALSLTARNVVLELPTAKGQARAAALRLRLVGANADPRITGLEQLPGRVNYIIGNDRRSWITGVPTYARVDYHDVYPGVDLVYHGRQGRLEYDYVLRPDADPAAIALAREGAGALRLDAQGNLVLESAGGQVRQERPVAYQDIAGKRRVVAARFVLRSDNTAGFALGAYDRRYALTIDPVLNWSTYLRGGNQSNQAVGVASDSSGNVYVLDSASDAYPYNNSQCGQSGCAVVIKLTSGGTPAYTTYIAGFVGPKGIAADANGYAYIVGTGTTPLNRGHATASVAGGLARARTAFAARARPRSSVWRGRGAPSMGRTR